MPQQTNPSQKPSAALVYIGQALGIDPAAANDFTKRVNRLVEYPGLDLYRVRCHVCALFQAMTPKKARRLSDEEVADLVEERAAGRHLTRVARALTLRPYQARTLVNETRERLRDKGVTFVPGEDRVADYVEAHAAALRPIAAVSLTQVAQHIAADRCWGTAARQSSSPPVKRRRQMTVAGRTYLRSVARGRPQGTYPGHQNDAEREFEAQFGDWETD